MAYVKKADQLRVLILEDDINRINIFRDKYKMHDLYFFDVADDAIAMLDLMKDKPWDTIFLDHDLGGQIFVSSTEHNTGYTVARFIEDHRDELEIKQIIIHSMNPAGAANMKAALPEATVIPFAILRTRI